LGADDKAVGADSKGAGRSAAPVRQLP